MITAASKNPWPEVPLGQVLTKSEDWIAVQSDQNYKEVTVRLWGKGVCLRRECMGSEIKSDRRLRVRPAQFIASRIDARNGAFGLIPDELDGAVVTNDFPTFSLNQSRMEPAFLGWLSRTATFVDLCRAASEGTTNRVRLKEEKFLSMAIGLPPIEDQRRIVARIEELAAKLNDARGLRKQAVVAMTQLLSVVAMKSFAEGAQTHLGDYVSLQSGYAFKSEWFSADGVRLARNVNVGHGKLEWDQVARIPSERKQEFARFELNTGDILISLDRPIISTGIKVAQVQKEDLPCLLLQRVARILFKDLRVLPEYLFRWFQSVHFSRAIDPGRSNGVPHISPKDVERLPFNAPSLDVQRNTIACLDSLSTKAESLKQLQSTTAAELEALLPSVLDRAFRGEL